VRTDVEVEFACARASEQLQSEVSNTHKLQPNSRTPQTLTRTQDATVRRAKSACDDWRNYITRTCRFGMCRRTKGGAGVVVKRESVGVCVWL
jgi:hypothetical protein